ncbi:lipoprotein insertase outer membrane protein LolB [Lysobacter arvi]|uniref:Outer-membrane lipoprotein LolB n=1 Tax=Lysobacter arvi TaxID=3038776 RepID=A0ABU1CDQ6_9GAMM|nr:lipoprotein insertase outer membrane protein LolB [Lysobacter arvi]MDR0183313.1 lipoprotein insertase outer membrane protein LolB [Lysobacter arvi]
MKVRAWFAPVAAMLLLAGCVSQPTRAPVAPIDQAQARAQDERRAALTDWALAGRIAVSNGKQGGSGRIDWQQTGDRYAISLSAPVTRQSWRLSGDATGGRLDGIEGGPREAADVEALLRETTGWNIPVRALADWVRGVGADAGRFGKAQVVYGAGNRPVRLVQAGWTIDYTQWQADADAGTGPVLPARLTARRGEAKVRLIVDAWGPGSTP